MANKTFQSRIVQKHDTEANWKKATNFVPLKGEIIVYDDLNKIKIGDGITKVNDLKFTTVNPSEIELIDLATVATSGSYNDLNDKPTIPTTISQLEDDTTFIVTVTGNGTTDSPYTANYTPQDILAQQSAGKKIYLNNNNILYPLVAVAGAQVSVFARLGQGNQAIQFQLTNSAVTKTIYPIQTTNNKVITLNSSSTDTQYPSAKAVYDNLQNYLPLTGGTLTGNININSKTIINLKTPTADTEAANKKYVDDQIAANDHIVNRFTFTATEGQSTFTIPFDFEDSSALTIYYNGVMMKETDNYTVSGKVITLVDFTAEANDYLTVMGIEGAAAIDYGKEAAEAIKQIQAVKTSAINEINTVKTDTIKQINDVVAELPQDLSSIMFTNKTNTMAANSKITMYSTYTPSANEDVATKKYVDDSKPSIVGTATIFPIYIGSSTPASGTAPLLWIDTSSSGTFKYRTSKTGTWKSVPVAWS